MCNKKKEKVLFQNEKITEVDNIFREFSEIASVPIFTEAESFLLILVRRCSFNALVVGVQLVFSYKESNSKKKKKIGNDELLTVDSRDVEIYSTLISRIVNL